MCRLNYRLCTSKNNTEVPQHVQLYIFQETLVKYTTIAGANQEQLPFKLGLYPFTVLYEHNVYAICIASMPHHVKL